MKRFGAKTTAWSYVGVFLTCCLSFPRILCRHLHVYHHKYNKEHTLSPFAGLAFHPVDGIMQVNRLPFIGS